jgi:hypothetical protein
MRLDHIAVSAASLDEGTAWVEEALGVRLSPGGRHRHMGTCNRLLSLGDVYLEVITTDPAAPRPDWPRWFDLDRFSGPPRLTNWIVAVENLKAELAAGPEGLGHPVKLERGDLHWEMAIPPDGRLPFDDAFPAVIHWQGTDHPIRHLPDSGLRLVRLEITHPRAGALRHALEGRFHDARVSIVEGPAKAIHAEFHGPKGECFL